MSELKFGTDGIRGKAGESPCTAEVGVAVGRAAVRLARVSSPGGRVRIVVGRDTRPSGPMLEAAVAAGIAAEGGDAMLVGVLPTSAVACSLASGHGDVGVMLTASHNPPEDNGFKVLGPGGRKLTDEESAQVEAWLVEDPRSAEPGTLRDAQHEAWEAYTGMLAKAVPERHLLNGRRIAVDLANGAASPMREWLVSEVPASFVFVGAGTGLPNDGVGSEHPERLQEIVRSERCDAGIAVDGDADRCRLVDETGALVDGDALAWLLTRGRNAHALAVTVMSTTALEASLPGVRIKRTPVGDKHLVQAIAAGEATLGCEESGHVVFDDALPTGDGLVTGLRALCIALRGGGTLSGAVAPFRPFPRKVTKVKVKARPKLEEVAPLQRASAEGEAALGANGRVFLRYSGTEPVLRVLVEGPDAAVVDQVSANVTAVARETLG
jgi:phosphoglucosamine mutase